MRLSGSRGPEVLQIAIGICWGGSGFLEALEASCSLLGLLEASRSLPGRLGAFWSFLGPPGASWGFLRLPGACGNLPGPSESSWSLQELPEAFWRLLEFLGPSWDSLGPKKHEDAPRRFPDASTEPGKRQGHQEAAKALCALLSVSAILDLAARAAQLHLAPRALAAALAMIGGFPAEASPGLAMGSVGGQRASQPWDTNDPKTNGWLEAEVDDAAREQLARLPVVQRTRLAVSIQLRVQAGNVNNASTYTCGAVRRELEKISYGSNKVQRAPGAMPPAFGQQIPPSGSAPGFVTAAGRPVASVHSPTMPPRPDWITAAWQLQTQKAPLFRAVQRSLSAEAMEALTKMPSHMQAACILSMLINNGAYKDPACYVQTFFNCWGSMPQLPPSSSGSSSSSAAAHSRRAVVLTFGFSNGADLFGLKLAITSLQTDRMNIETLERLSFSQCCDWQPVLDDLFTKATAANAFSHFHIGEAMAIIQQRAPIWKSSGVQIVALLCLPQAQPSFLNHACTSKGYHTGKASDIWLMMAALRTLSQWFQHIMLAVLEPPSKIDRDTDFLNTIFCPAMQVDPAQFRVPHDAWSIRSFPAGTSGPVAARPFEDPGATDVNQFHPVLRSAWDSQQPYKAILPTLAELEDIADSRTSNHAISPEQVLSVRLVSQGGEFGEDGHVRSLLGREALAAAFGMSQWPLTRIWDARLPCMPWINNVTGLACSESDHEGSACGAFRLCASCGYFYQSLTEGPSSFYAQDVFTRIMKAGVFSRCC